MKKKLLVLILGIFVLSLAVYPDCALQSDAEVDFTISIPINANIHQVNVALVLDSDADETGIGFQVLVPGEGSPRTFTGFYNEDTGNEISTAIPPASGYYIRLNGVQVSAPEHIDNYELIIIRKPMANPSGDFDYGTGSEVWHFYIKGLIGNYEIKNVTTNQTAATDLAGDPLSMAGIAVSEVSPCNTAPTVDGINAPIISTTDPFKFTFEADNAIEIDPTPDQIVYYEWDYGYSVESNPQTSMESTNPHVYTYLSDTDPTNETFDVKVRVQDSHGAWSEWTSAVEVSPNQRPSLVGINAPPSTGEPLYMNLSAIFPDSPALPDPDIGDTLSYEWNLDNDTTFETVRTDNNLPEQEFSPDGSYTVKLRVRDDKGLASEIKEITFDTDDKPIADIILNPATSSPFGTDADGNIIAKAPAQFALTPQSSDDNVAVTQIVWDVDVNGDGDYDDPEDTSFTDTSTPAFGDHIVTFNDPGTYHIRIQSTAGNFDSEFVGKTIKVITNSVVTFPMARGLPYDTLKEPLIDGILTGPDSHVESDGTTIYGENGWRGAHMFTFNNGTSLDGSVMFLRSRDNNSLIIGFEINDLTFGNDDVIVLGFRDGEDDRISAPDADHASKLIYIFPTERGNGAQANLEAEVQIYELNNVNGLWEQLVIDDETGTLEDNEWDIGLDTPDDPPYTWTMEIQIPLNNSNGTGLDGFGNDFLFFFDIFKSQTGGSVEPVRWPRDLPDIPGTVESDTTDIITHRDSIEQFNPLWWGIANLSDALHANGLSLPSASYVGVRTNPGDTTLSSTIDHDDNNTFAANVLNTSQKDTYHVFNTSDGEEKAVQTLPVDDVTVTFKIANWGIGPGDTNYWYEFGSATSNISAPNDGRDEYYYDNDGADAEIIPDDHTHAVEIVWNPATDPDFTPQQIHQCIHVELFSPNQADIVTRSVHRNLNFDALNDGPVIFIHPAEISAQGYGLPPQGEQEHKILLRIFTNTWDVEKDEVLAIQKDKKRSIGRKNPYFFETLPFILEADDTISFIEYIVKGYLYTGKKLIVREEERELVEPIGSYGHVVRHEGTVEEWDFYIEGAERIDKNTYIITIPPEETATITDNVKAIEPPKYRIHAAIGGILPIYDLADNYKIGPNFIVGAGYHLNPQYSIHALFGYNYLYSNATGVDDTTLMSLSLNVRRHFPLGNNFSCYAGTGVGAYFDTAMNKEFGINTGGGINYRLTRLLELEAGADYHYLIDSHNQYIHGHAGIQFRF